MQETTGTQTRRGGNTHRGLAKPDDPIYKEGWTITMGPSGRLSKMPSESTESDNQHQGGEEVQETTGQKTRKAGATYLGPAKPDDPVFKEGWTITLGGLRGRLKTPSVSTPEEKPDNQNQDQQNDQS